MATRENRTHLLLLIYCLLLGSCHGSDSHDGNGDSHESGENQDHSSFHHQQLGHSHFQPSSHFQQQRHHHRNSHSQQSSSAPQKNRQSTGFSHFSLPKHRNGHSFQPVSPAAKFSVFASHPQNNNNFIGHQSPKAKTKIFPAKLKHFKKFGGHKTHASHHQPAPPISIQKARPVILQNHHSSHRFGHNQGFTPANRLDGNVDPNQNIFPQFVTIQTYCPNHQECQPIVRCAPFYYFLMQQPDAACSLPNGGSGVCCPFVTKPQLRPTLIRRIDRVVPIRSFSQDEINDAAKEGLYELTERDNFDQRLIANNIVVTDRNSPAFLHLQFFRTTPAAMRSGRDALKIVLTSGAIVRRFKLNSNEAAFGLDTLNVQNSLIGDTCPVPVQCSRKDDFYRRTDGQCNNQRNSLMGGSRTGFNRIVAPQYENGIEAPRTLSQVGVKLPSARVVSISNIVDADRPSPYLSLSVMQWGQFIDHDLTHVPIRRFGNETGIECCDSNGNYVDRSMTHSSCFAIEIPNDDPFYRQYNQRCMNFVRSEIAPKENCSLGYKEQMNQVTHYLDGSAVYGSSEELERELRTFRGGLLRSQNSRFLPRDNSVESDCGAIDRRSCFAAGDNRVNEQPDLTAIHTIMMREHNRIANMLSNYNPHWSDETIFQETRRIVVAQIQHIVYNEWLPVIIGTDFSLKNHLIPLRDGFTYDYDSGVDSRILNEFATVAFRFGHTLIEGMVDLFDKNHRKTQTVQLHKHFNSPGLLYTPGKLEEFLRGLIKQPMQSFDNFITDSVQNRLFQTKRMPFGMDLVALNIQRGRDHAVANYNELRASCGLPRARRFSDFRDYIPSDVIETFKLLYPSIEDIDPFIAGISERPVEGGVVGPTFRCIIADQFKRLKRGDRFFYENGGMSSSFTDAQLYEIKKSSWARLLCDNGINIKHVQPLAMRLPGPLNEKASCYDETIPSVDLSPWISERR